MNSHATSSSFLERLYAAKKSSDETAGFAGF